MKAFPLFFLRWLAAPAACLLLAGCGEKAPQTTVTADGRKLTKVTVQTDWYAQPEHGGFYQALVKGYYRDAGLDVTINQGGPNIVPLQRVALGQLEFAIGRSDDLSVAVERGLPVVMVGALMQRDPQAIVFHQGSGIKSFKDLNGRSIMTVPGSNFLLLLEKKYGIKVSVLPLDMGLSRFLADPQFIQQCFITNEPYYLRKMGANPGTLLLSDMGFAPYRVWFTSREFAAKNPEAVRAFTAASIRGWSDYLTGDRTAADQMISALNKHLTPEFNDYCVGVMRDAKLVAGDPAQGEAVGRIDPSRIETLLKQLTDIGIITKPLKVADVFDDRFLPDDVRVKPATK